MGLIYIAFLVLTAQSVAQYNLVPNPSVETPSYFEQWGPPQGSHPDKWHPGYRGIDNASIYNYLYIPGHSGMHAIKVEITKNSSVDAKWSFDRQPVEGGKYYEVSDFYVSTVPSQMYVTFGLKDGSDRTISLHATPASPTGWIGYFDIVLAPRNAVNFTMFHAISDVGSLTTDDYSLTKAPPEVIAAYPKKDMIAQETLKRRTISARENDIRQLKAWVKKTTTTKLPDDDLLPSVPGGMK